MNNEEEDEMIVNPKKSDSGKRPHPLLEAKRILQKAMKESGRTPEDVKRDIELSRFDD